MGYWPILGFSNVFSVLGQFWGDFLADYRVLDRFQGFWPIYGFEPISRFRGDFRVHTRFLGFDHIFAVYDRF